MQAAHRLAPTIAKPALVVAAFGMLATPLTTRAQDAGRRPDEIIVTSSIVSQPRRQVGAAVSVIDFADIELRGYTHVADLLRTQPGVAVDNSGGLGKDTAVRIRGEESYRTTLLIDGIKAVDPSAPRVAPSFESLLTASGVQRVEVLRGPQGFIYGADAGGVVNVITKGGGDGFGGQLGLELGELDSRRVDAALSGGSDVGDYFLSATDMSTGGFNAWRYDTDLRDADGADNMTLHAKLGWNVSDAVRTQLVMRRVDAESMFDNCFPGNDCLATSDQTAYKLSLEHTAGRLSSSFGYSGIEIARDSLNAGLSTFPTEGDLARFEYTGSFKASDALALVYGIDLQHEELASGDGTRSRDQRGYYVEYQGAPAETFFVSLGARYDDNDDFGAHTSSRLSLAYVRDLAEGRSLKYRASVGTGFRAPSLYEIAYNAGPYALPPASDVRLVEETTEGFDIGIEYDGASGLHVELTYFDQSIDNEITFDLSGFSGYLQSRGRSTSQGVELAADVALGSNFALAMNWTRNDADDRTGERRLRRPEGFGNVGVIYRPGDRFDLIANVRFSRGAFDLDGVALDDYEILDLAATYRLRANLDLYGRVQNATDERYVEVGGYNTAERTATIGVRMRF